MAKSNKTLKYWEAESAIETVTNNMEFHYFPEAGKFQMYGRYELDGEMRRTKAIVLDTEAIDIVEGVEILNAMAKVLLPDKIAVDITVLTGAYLGTVESDDEIVEEELSEVLDEEFEDEVQPVVSAYEGMSFKALKAACDERAIPYRKVGESKKSLISLLVAADKLAENTDEAGVSQEDETKFVESDTTATQEVESNTFTGKYLTFSPKTMEIGVSVPKSKRKAYKEAKQFASDAFSWIEVDLVEMVVGSLNTKGKNKGKVNDGKFTDAALEWIKSFEANDEVQHMLDVFVTRYHNAVSGVKVTDVDIKAENYFLSPELECEFVAAADAYFAS